MFFLLVNIIVKNEENIHLFDFITFYVRIYAQLKGLFMNYFTKAYDEIELEPRRVGEQKAKAIYDDLDAQFSLDRFFDFGRVEGYTNRLLNLLLFSGIAPIQRACLSLLRDNSANLNFFIPTLSSHLLLPSTPEEFSRFVAATVGELKMYTSFTASKNTIDITSEQSTMHMQSARMWLEERDGFKIDKNYLGQCHSVTYDLAHYFPSYYATTVLMPNFLGGSCFHSFFSTPDNEYIVDLSIGDVVKKGDFYSVMGCEEILNVRAESLEQMYEDLCSYEDVPNDMYPLLILALDSNRRR